MGCTVLFTLFNFAVYRVLPIDQITSMIEGGDIYLGTEVANTVLGSAGQIVVVIAMATAIFGSLNGCILVFPRQYYAMAKDGYFFKSFAYDGLLMGGLTASVAAAALPLKIPASLFNGAVAIILAPPLCVALRRSLKRTHIQLP